MINCLKWELKKGEDCSSCQELYGFLLQGSFKLSSGLAGAGHRQKEHLADLVLVRYVSLLYEKQQMREVCSSDLKHNENNVRWSCLVSGF